jgi:hypothetical protein
MPIEKHSDHAVMTFARCNPPTTGHAKLFNHVRDAARKEGADHHIFLSHTQDAKKNPLSHKQKREFIHKMVPGLNVHEEEGIKTPIDALKHLHKKGYTHVTMVVGGDRHEAMSNLVHKYNGGKDYHFKHLEVKSAGDRDPDAEGVEGMSASKMREHATKKNFKEFSKGVPKKEHAKELYTAVRKGMKLENYQAVFLVGGPGSGKDFILRTALSESGAYERPLSQTIQGAHVLVGNPPAIINGNAYDYDRIVVEAAGFQEQGYQVAMVYVYTTDADSHARNAARIRNGDKTISEATRALKYQQSVDNIHTYKDLFGEGFFLFDNSMDMLNEDTQEQTSLWIEELQEALGSFFEASRTPLTQSKDTAHKGYFIKHDWVHDEYHVSKDGHHITTQSSLESAKKAIDSLTEGYFEKPVAGIAAPKVPKPVGGGPAGGHDVPVGYERVKDGSFFKLRKIREEINQAFDEVLMEGAFPTGNQGHTTYEGSHSTNLETNNRETKKVRAQAHKHADHLVALGHAGVKVTKRSRSYTVPGQGITVQTDYTVHHGVATKPVEESLSEDVQLDEIESGRTIIDMEAKKQDTKYVKQGDKYKGGIAVAGAKDTERVVQEANQEVSVPQSQVKGVKYSKKNPARGASAPVVPYNSNIGQVPSGGVGLSTSIGESVKPKSFKQFRSKKAE